MYCHSFVIICGFIVALTRRDTVLEAFRHNTMDGSLAPPAPQLSVWTKCPNLRFHSYWAGLFSQRPSHQKGKTNLSHDGLNPAHIRYWWVNNPTLHEFCFTVIGRADIEGSKSDVAMNTWPPQASYPCGNFSDNSFWKLQAKRIDGPCFRSPYAYWTSGSCQLLPFCSTQVSVIAELALGHLPYTLTDVPP